MQRSCFPFLASCLVLALTIFAHGKEPVAQQDDGPYFLLQNKTQLFAEDFPKFAEYASSRLGVSVRLEKSDAKNLLGIISVQEADGDRRVVLANDKSEAIVNVAALQTAADAGEMSFEHLVTAAIVTAAAELSGCGPCQNPFCVLVEEDKKVGTGLCPPCQIKLRGIVESRQAAKPN